MFGINACALCTDRPTVVTVVVGDELDPRPSDALRYRKGGTVKVVAESAVCDGCSEDLVRYGADPRDASIGADGRNAPTYKVRLPWKAIIAALRD